LKKGITIVAAIAAVLAVTSGAFAAGNHVISASSQIKDGAISILDLSPNARKALKGQNGAKGAQGQKGATGAKGDKGDAGATIGSFGPVHLSNRDDNGCATPTGQEVWAKTASDRHFTVEPIADGTGYLVTRYDVHGTFETIAGAKHPGCDDPNVFAGVESGTWTGVWTQKVPSNTPGFDYNPDAAMPASGSWSDFLVAAFNLAPNTNLDTTSYEFDYYNDDCDGHWRDSYYGGASIGSGTIEDC
jgi:hypothetical protein